jgi:hypothetical protein
MKINYRKTGVLNKAGLAFIEYDEKVKQPKRVKDLITLPVEGYELFQADESFSQFLFLSIAADDYNRQLNCWFGGTDELPFLVQLNRYDWKKAWAKDKFYEEIKPDIIKRFEGLYGPHTKRQGDIFAYELPKELQDFEKLRALVLIGDDRITNFSDYSNHSVFRTRHMIEGKITIHWKHPIARGIIRAPDHADLVLDNWHILAQTEGLHTPEKAD